MKESYKNSVYGIWSVSTEGDEEGRSTRQLGIYEGFVDDIAFHLADNCFYSLKFKLVEPVSLEKVFPKKKSVHVCFDIASDTWDDKNRLDSIKEMFRQRPVFISESNYYVSFVINANNPEDIERNVALAKLTEKEKRILGLM